MAIILSSLLLFGSCGKTSDFESVSDNSSDTLAVSTDPLDSKTPNRPDAEQPENSEDDLYIGDKFISDSEKEPIRAHNFPSLEEVQAKYPDKLVLTWLITDFGFLDTCTPFRTVEVNEYLDSLGLDFAVCFIPLDDHTQYYPDVLNSLIEEGTQIDLLCPSYRWSTEAEQNDYQRDAKLGLLEPLNWYFENTESGKDYYESMPEAYFDTFRINGEIYGVYGGSNTNLTGPYGYSVDKDLAEKYGWDINKPILEQLSVIQEAVESEPSIDGAYLWNYGMPNYYPQGFDYWYGVYWDDENGKFRSITDSPEYHEWLDILYELNSNNLIVYKDGTENSSCFLLIGEQPFYGENGGVYTIDYNGYPSERMSVFSGETEITNSSSAIGISSRSDNKEEAFALLMLTQTDPYLNNLLVFGIEGEDYGFVDGCAEGSENVVMNFNRFGNLAVCHPFGNYPKAINQKYFDLFETSERTAYLGFDFDVSPVAKEFLSIKSIMTDYDYLNKSYESADQSLANLDIKLSEAGIDAVIGEINRQYYEWKENDR